MTNNDWFRGRTALVTGASSGMGRAIAIALGNVGARVGVNYNRNADAAAAVKAEIEAAGGEAVVLQADVSQADAVSGMFKDLQAAFGDRLDMLVNNAGQWMDKSPIVECTEAQFDLMMDVNIKSVFLCSQQAARIMTAQDDGGAIVNFGSVAGHTGGGGGTVPYGAAKAAVHTFTRGLARELGPQGVRVNAISPGMIETPMLDGRVSPEVAKALNGMTPLGRMGKPEEIAGMTLMLLSPASSYMTGEIVEVNGGLLMR